MTTRLNRRKFLGTAATGAAGALAAPAIATAQGQTTTWKIQTSWPGGAGLQADATQVGFAFDQADPFAQAGGLQRGALAAGAGADHQQVVVILTHSVTLVQWESGSG